MSEGDGICMDRLEELLAEHMAFLVRCVSTFTGRYVYVEQDDEFSIALEAFAEAVQRYDAARGSFLSFAGMVVRSRLIQFAQKEKRRGDHISLDALAESGLEPAAPVQEEQSALREEIDLFRRELSLFSLDLETLADEAPRHRDTRARAVDIAERSSADDGIVRESYCKRSLPVRAVARLCQISEKTVKGSRSFILAVLLIFVKKFPLLLQWVRHTRNTSHA